MSSINRKIDIIIPVYNALDDLKLCVDSVKKTTDLKRHRLILINDKSSDENVWPYMQSIEAENILIFNNEKNLGFSGNINKGIVFSDRDVILLNSDTIVTDRWVEKIVACAYSDPAIGTVTPLSNNATLCSVPNFCEENTVPDGFTIESYAQLIGQCSTKRYPEIPVAHGFCMFIKREVFDKIGLFDAETFGRGYGEENDFCHRAGQIGYIHVMCDDTYIYHSGTSSFQSEEKKKYIEAHDKIIYQRYQKQVTETRVHCAENPNKAVADNIELYAELTNGKKNILYVLHYDFREKAFDNVGGIQLHVKDLVAALRSKYNVFVMARNGNLLNLTVYTGEKDMLYQFPIEGERDYPVIRKRKFYDIYFNILNHFNIDLVHVHHVQGMSFEVFYATKDLNIPVVATIHDYYYVCPNVKLLNHEKVVCLGKEDPETCRTCLRKKFDIAEMTRFMENWRLECKNILKNCQFLITPSLNAKENFLLYYPEFEEKMLVIAHGSDSQAKNKDVITPQTFDSEPVPEKNDGDFHVAFVGGLSVEKGAELAYGIIKHNIPGVHFYTFGEIGYRPLDDLSRKNLTKTGAYNRSELDELIKKHKIDLICILSIWPETFCYTVSEAVLAEIPLIVTDMGALAERVREMGCGLVVSADASAKEIAEQIVKLKNNKDIYKKLADATQKDKIRSISSMVEEYDCLYQKYPKKQQSESTLENYRFILKHRYPIFDVSIEAEFFARAQQKGAELQAIKNSTTYKLMKSVGSIKIPFREQIKKMLEKRL